MLYEEGNEVVSLKSNAAGTNKFDWFSQANLISSPWGDLKTAANVPIFDVTGDWNRYFEITKSYGGCSADVGWLVITGGACSWETRVPIPSIQYSKLGNAIVWGDYGKSCSKLFLVMHVTLTRFMGLLWDLNSPPDYARYCELRRVKAS